MKPTILSIRPVDVAALLELLRIVPYADSPLRSHWRDFNPRDTSEPRLCELGLLVDGPAGRRVNAAVGLALATLAQPEESLEIAFANGTHEHATSIARVGHHFVALQAGDEKLELLIPLERDRFVETLYAQLNWTSDDSIAVDHIVTPVGQFLIGVLARNHSEPATIESLSDSVDRDILRPDLVCGLHALEPGAIDRLYRNPGQVAEQLELLMQARAVRCVDGRYLLQRTLYSLLTSRVTTALDVRRVHFEKGTVVKADGLTALHFFDAILQSRTIRGGGRVGVHLRTVTREQLAAHVSAMLFSDGELRSLGRSR